MAIQAGTDDRGAALHGPAWYDVLTGSDLGDGVFDVRWDLRPRLRRWLAAHDLPTAGGGEPHLSVVDAWAVLDGGVFHVSALDEGPCPVIPVQDALTPGMRVVGFRTLRLLVTELALAGADRLLPGEPPTDPDALRAQFANRVVDDAGREQAELLATCTDRMSLRWVAGALGVSAGQR